MECREPVCFLAVEWVQSVVGSCRDRSALGSATPALNREAYGYAAHLPPERWAPQALTPPRAAGSQQLARSLDNSVRATGRISGRKDMLRIGQRLLDERKSVSRSVAHAPAVPNCSQNREKQMSRLRIGIAPLEPPKIKTLLTCLQAQASPVLRSAVIIRWIKQISGITARNGTIVRLDQIKLGALVPYNDPRMQMLRGRELHDGEVIVDGEVKILLLELNLLAVVETVVADL